MKCLEKLPHHNLLQDGIARSLPGAISKTSWKAGPLTGNSPEANPGRRKMGKKAALRYLFEIKNNFDI